MEHDDARRGAPEFEIVRAYVLLQLWADASVPQFGIETFELHLLFRLRGAPGITQAELGRRLARDAMSVSRLVRGLEAKGLVERRPIATDARAWSVRLTRRGESLLAKVLGALDEDGPLRGWSRSDVDRLTELVRRAGDAYREACERAGARTERNDEPRHEGARRHGAEPGQRSRSAEEPAPRPRRSGVVRAEAEEPVPRAAKRARR